MKLSKYVDSTGANKLFGEVPLLWYGKHKSINSLGSCRIYFLFQVEKIITIMSNPRQYKIPDWFLNRQKDIVDGKYSQLTSSYLDSKLREDLERLKKIRAHRGMRHYWGLRVRGQHTKTTGRRGRTVGVSKKK
uniref:Small ribosomal subunit protein uS13 n=1 Tax=Timema bartmani TaxID=61472 RepID=A0A7R9F662_9NEOP|nr:unnamed protein product [Timema bartmani]